MLRRAVFAALPPLLAVTGCGVAGPSSSTQPVAGNAETDRIAGTVATAIGTPRHETIEGYARAALDTPAGRDGRLTVVAMESLRAKELVDPLGRLTFRIEAEGSTDRAYVVDNTVACYSMAFSYYGWVDHGGPPRRSPCPTPAAPITPRSSAEIDDTVVIKPCYSGSNNCPGG